MVIDQERLRRVINHLQSRESQTERLSKIVKASIDTDLTTWQQRLTLAANQQKNVQHIVTAQIALNLIERLQVIGVFQSPAIRIILLAPKTATVNSRILLTVESSTPGELAYVQFQINDINLGERLYTEPFSVRWVVPTISGDYAVRAIAVNTSGVITQDTKLVVALTSNLSEQQKIIQANSMLYD